MNITKIIIWGTSGQMLSVTFSFFRRSFLHIKAVIAKRTVISAYISVSESALVLMKSIVKKDGRTIRRNAIVNVVKLTAVGLRAINKPIPIKAIALKHVRG